MVIVKYLDDLIWIKVKKTKENVIEYFQNVYHVYVNNY